MMSHRNAHCPCGSGKRFTKCCGAPRAATRGGGVPPKDNGLGHVRLGPGDSKAHNNLGVVLFQQGKLGEARREFTEALRLDPGLAEAHNNLGATLERQGRPAEAQAEFAEALRLMPGYADAHTNLGRVLMRQGALEAARAEFAEAVRLKPDHADAHVCLGRVLLDQGQLDEATKGFSEAVRLKPGDAGVHNESGIVLAMQGRLDEAMARFQETLRLEPGYPSAHYNRARLWLQMGRFDQGWPDYEWRWRLGNPALIPWSHPQPQWDGADLPGRTILLHCEQGFGDAIHFIRYAPLVAERCGRVVVVGDARLRRLFRSVAGVAQCVTGDEPLPPVDAHCPLMSLPLAFGTTLETVPRTVPYLQADPREIERWRERLAGGPGGLKVGLVWAGASMNQNDRNRSLPLALLAPLARVPGVGFYSLQKGEPARQAKNPPGGMSLIDWTEELDDFADTAALIANLDLVISVDTAAAHLAGALGRPTWVLLPAVADWRWLLGREDSPWYPTMRLFRQTTPGQWEDVFRHVADALQRRLAASTEVIDPRREALLP
jgi:Flp pilus assembly protein TadD